MSVEQSSFQFVSVNLSNEEELHNVIVSLLNSENYDNLANLCQEVISEDIENEIIQKVIFTLINHEQYQIVGNILKKFIEIDLTHNFIFHVVHSLIINKAFQSVIDIFRESLKLNPNNYLIKKIKALLINRKFFEPLVEITKLLIEFNSEIENVLNTLDSLIINKEYELLKKICYIILECEPYLILRIILLLSDNGRSKEALQLSLTIKKRLPRSPEVWNVVGYIFVNMGLHQKALKAFSYALKYVNSINSDFSSIIWKNIAWTFNELKDYEKAIKTCKKALRIIPDNGHSYNQLGFAYCMKGVTRKGIKLIKKSIALNRNNCHAWYNLSQLYFQLYNFDNAYNSCYQCLSINNQFQKAVMLYNEIVNSPILKAISILLPRISTLGYRAIIHDKDYRLLKDSISFRSENLIPYSKNFKILLTKLQMKKIKNIIAISGLLPECSDCKKPLRMQGHSFDHEYNVWTTSFICKEGHREEKCTTINNKNAVHLKVIIIVKSLVDFPEKEIYLKKESLSIIFRTPEMVDKELHNYSLLYGKEIFDENHPN